ncbi:MAG: alkaline phosphatase family protein [Candidatus Aenigmarchaeota archaeon]|nr:alkaline phosphatase family protein [Candidatus Aenigmarchaeota archaeon]
MMGIEEEFYVFPTYDSKNIVNIPSFVSRIFGVKANKCIDKKLTKSFKGYKNVVLFILDGFGYSLLEYVKDVFEFTKNFEKEGTITKLTSTFPSSTAPAVVSIFTGKTPIEHGVVEWYTYVEKIRSVIEAIPLTTIEKIKLSEKEFKHSNFFYSTTIFQRLKKVGVESFYLVSRFYAQSSFSKFLSKGGKVVPFISYGDIPTLVKSVVSKEGKKFVIVYLDMPDSLEHFYNFGNEVLLELSLFDRIFSVLRKEVNDTLFLLTADHGGTTVSKFINIERIKVVRESLERKGKRVIPPYGWCRSIFLRLKKSKVKTTFETLERKLKGYASVYLSEDLISKGVFGPRNGKFSQRFGDVIVVPKKGVAIYSNYMKNVKKFNGFHGGLSLEEMLVPFGILAV